MDKIYLVYEVSDKTEGRGSMMQVPDSGFFVNEEEAWDFADSRYGVMGRTPKSGSWRNETYPDVKVVTINKHDSNYQKRKTELKNKIKQLHDELYNLEQNR